MFSLVIPSINRPNFLKQYVDFLEYQNFDGEVIIGDSSNDENYKIFEEYYKSKKLPFRITHLQKKNKDHFEVVRELVPLIKFEYSMYICDDDYILYKNVKKCINFLKENNDYSVVGGISLGIVLNSKNTNQIDFIDELNFYELLEDKASLRLKKLAEEYSVIAYSISRTSDLKKRWLINTKMTSRDIAVEVHPCFHMAVEGKVKKINDIFVFRLLHSKRILDPALPLDRFLNPKYFISIKESINILSKIISIKENIDDIAAESLVKISYNDYIRRRVNRRRKYKNYFFLKIKRIIERIKYIIINKDIKYLLINKHNEDKIFNEFNTF